MRTSKYLLAACGMFAIAGMTTAIAANADVSSCSDNAPYQEAWNRGDAAAVVAFYAPDGIEVTPDGIKAGQAAIKERIDQAIKQLKNLVIVVTKCDVTTDVKWSSGTWKAESPQGPVGSLFTVIQAKNGDTWKIQNNTFNVPLPPPPRAR